MPELDVVDSLVLFLLVLLHAAIGCAPVKPASMWHSPRINLYIGESSRKIIVCCLSRLCLHDLAHIRPLVWRSWPGYPVSLEASERKPGRLSVILPTVAF